MHQLLSKPAATHPVKGGGRSANGDWQDKHGAWYQGFDKYDQDLLLSETYTPDECKRRLAMEKRIAIKERRYRALYYMMRKRR